MKMNKNDVLNELAKLTGVDKDECEKILAAFEKEAEIKLENKIRGIKSEASSIAAGVASRTGFTIEKCEKVIDKIKPILSSTLAKKWRF